MRVTVVGTGYVGLTTGVTLAYLGHQVVAVDHDAEKIELLVQGVSPIHEPGLEVLLGQMRDRLSFTTDTAAAARFAEVILIAVGTPVREKGDADISSVEEAARQVAQGLDGSGRPVLVIKSTVPVGTGRRVAHVVGKVLSEKGCSNPFIIASNPEFLREGKALHDTFYPDRIVVGAECPEAVEALRRLYRPILEQTFVPPPFLPRPEGYRLPALISSDPTSAEMTKYAANAFLALKISFINEIAGLCERVGADVREVSRGIGVDARIGAGYLEAGLGWGGSCFPKDTAALQAMAAEYGYTMPLLAASRQVNDRQRLLVIEKLQVILKVLRGRLVAILGLAFKPDTDDVREAPALDIIRQLLDMGAGVKAHDPVAILRARQALTGLDVEFMGDPYELVSGCDAVVLTTAWPEYRGLDLAELARRMRTPVLIDGRNIFSPRDARRAGFTYMGVGR